MLDVFIKYILGEFRVIWNAPLSFVISTLAATFVIWVALDWRYSGVVAGKVGQLELQDRQILDLKQKIDELTAQPTKLAKPHTRKEEPLTPITGNYFKNERVPLDGFNYTRCTFENVTLVYNGGPFSMTYNTIKGFVITSESPEITSAMKLLFDLGYIKFPGMNETGLLQPSNPVEVK